MEKSAIREKSIKGEKWQLVKREGGVVWNLKCPCPLCLVSARWRRTGSTWPWSLTGYSSGCLSWCAYWDPLDSFSLLGWLEWSRNALVEGKTDSKTCCFRLYKKIRKTRSSFLCLVFCFSKKKKKHYASHPLQSQKVRARRNEIKYLSAIPEIVWILNEGERPAAQLSFHTTPFRYPAAQLRLSPSWKKNRKKREVTLNHLVQKCRKHH